MREVAGFGANFLIKTIRFVLGRFRPSEDVSAWYLREVRPRFLPQYFAPPIIP